MPLSTFTAILTTLVLGVVVVFLIVGIRFVLSLSKASRELTSTIINLDKYLSDTKDNLKTGIDSISKNVVAIRETLECTIGKTNTVLESIPNTMENLNITLQAINNISSVVDTITYPVKGVQRYSSALGKFIGAFRNRWNNEDA